MITRKPEQLFENPQPAAQERHSKGRATYDERLDRILRAAAHEFARVGYHRTTMRALAKASDTSLAGLYHYFESKQKMLFLIQFRTFNSLLNNLREKLHGVDDPQEQLRVMTLAHVTYFAENMAELKACSHELDSLSGEAYAEIRTTRHEYYKRARGIIQRILTDNGGGNGMNPHVATMSLFGTLNWLYRWYDPQHDPSPAVVAQQIVNQFLNGAVGKPGTDHRTSEPQAPARGLPSSSA